jgi:hypothetical protein
MFAAMRRLHPRGPECRSVVVDVDGAMLGPDCVLVRRTPAGFRCVGPGEARAIQAAVLDQDHDPDWLFEQSRRIAATAGLIKANFNPDSRASPNASPAPASGPTRGIRAQMGTNFLIS